MAQTRTRSAGRSRSGGSTRRAGSTTARSRGNSARSRGGKSSNARRSTKSSASKSPKSAGRIPGVTTYLGDVTSKSMNGRVRAVARNAKRVGAVAKKAKGLGAVAKKAKGLGAVGAAGLAGVAGVAGGIALDRWNHSYSRTQAFARSRPGRSMRKALQGARSGVVLRRSPSKLAARGKIRR